MGRVRVTENELLEAVRAAVHPTGRPGPDWLSTAEIAAQLGLSGAAARHRLRLIERRGGAECVLRAGATGSVVAYWRLKNGGKT